MSSRAQSRGRRAGNSLVLQLPSSRTVSQFREQRLLLHLYEQLVEQVDVNPIDWMLHFQLGNLLAFSEDYNYGNNRESDLVQAEEHYQTALMLLQQTHEQDYAMYQMKHNMLDTPVTPMDDLTFTEAGIGAILYEDEEEKFDQPMQSMLKLPITISVTAALESNDPGYSETESDDGTPSSHRARSKRSKHTKKVKQIRKMQAKSKSLNMGNSLEFPVGGGMFGGQPKEKRKRASLKEMQQEREQQIDYRAQIDNTSLFRIKNAYRDNGEEGQSTSRRLNKLKMWKQNKPRKKYKVKKRKLMIKVRDSNNNVSQEFTCKYTAALSEEEMQREHERKIKFKLNRKTVTFRYSN